MERVLAVILGGGRGTRLYPLTKMRAKPAVPLAGKYRLIDIPLSNCIHSGVNRIYILTQFLSTSLHRHVYETYRFDVFSKGFVDLLPAEQTLTGMDWYQGTADAVRHQLHRIRRKKITDVLILPGDHLYRMDYRELIRYHRERSADITICVTPVARGDVARFGILKQNREGCVQAYREKPSAGSSDLSSLMVWPGDAKPFCASMGIYVFRKDVLLDALSSWPGKDFGGDIIPAAVKRVRMAAFTFRGYWEDIGTIRSFYQSNLALVPPEPAFDLFDQARPVYTRSRFLPPSRVDGCRITHSVISDGSRLERAEMDRCVIGLRSIVRPGAKMKNVIMMGADYYENEAPSGLPPVGIGRDVMIEDAIVDKNIRIGEGSVILSHKGGRDVDQENYSVRDGIVVIPKNAVIPPGTRLETQGGRRA